MVIIMHNKIDYLDKVYDILKKEGVSRAAFIDRKNMGSIIQGGIDYVGAFGNGQLMPEYDRGVVSVVEDEARLKRILDTIDSEPSVKMMNVDNTGFIAVVPMRYVDEARIRGDREIKGKSGMADYFTEERIILDLKATDKAGAMAELGVVLETAPEMKDYGRFIEDVMEREKMATTGIGNGIALPHARTDAVSGVLLAAGRSPNGVDFKSVDGNAAKLVVLIGTPKSSGLNHYLKLLAYLTRVTRKQGFMREIMNAGTREEIAGLFRSAGKGNISNER